jgi:hypothetical protein
MHRLTVAEAAQHLGITSDALRQRIRRGSINHERDQDGKVYVYIRSDEMQHDARQDAYRDELIQELRNRIEAQERELERKDAIIMQMARSIGQLEAPASPRRSPEASRTPRESPVSGEDGPPYGTSPQEAEESLHHVPYGASPQEAEESLDRRSWWQRLFGG